MKIVFAFGSLCVTAVLGALPPSAGYHEAWCPPGSCLQGIEYDGGFAGPQHAFVQCFSEQTDEVSDEIWTPVNEDNLPEDWHHEECTGELKTARHFEGCGDVMCTLFCGEGFAQDENGCEICQCAEAEDLATGDVCYQFYEDGSKPVIDRQDDCPFGAHCVSDGAIGFNSVMTCEYNCYTKEAWTAEKGRWCCENQDLGCSDSHQGGAEATDCGVWHVDCTAGGDRDAYCVFGDHCGCSDGFVCSKGDARFGRECYDMQDGTEMGICVEGEEPCVVVDCAPGFDLVGVDENGCGGECVKVPCTVEFARGNMNCPVARCVEPDPCADGTVPTYVDEIGDEDSCCPKLCNFKCPASPCENMKKKQKKKCLKCQGVEEVKKCKRKQFSTKEDFKKCKKLKKAYKKCKGFLA